jgi:hypothetical protein
MDAAQRRLIISIVIATLLTLAVVIADLAIGGRPDPPTLRVAATQQHPCDKHTTLKTANSSRRPGVACA